MKYFVTSVNILSTTGKSRKGAILQAAAKRFEHTIIADDDALSALVHQLKCLVDSCNETFPGKDAILHSSLPSGYVYANTGSTGHESCIFCLSFVPIGGLVYAHIVRNAISDALYDNEPALLPAYRKHAYKEGE